MSPWQKRPSSRCLQHGAVAARRHAVQLDVRYAVHVVVYEGLFQVAQVVFSEVQISENTVTVAKILQNAMTILFLHCKFGRTGAILTELCIA